MPSSAPAQSLGYIFDATVVPYQGGSLGFLSLWPVGESQPVVSTLNAYDGAITSNMAIVPAGTNGEINTYAGFGTTSLILDISGFYAPWRNPTTSGLACPTQASFAWVGLSIRTRYLSELFARASSVSHLCP